MKIIALQAENVKKLRAVEIRPQGNLVEITGKNGQGKTSVLDSIWWALAGTKHIQAAPIRKGATEARIRLDLGEIVVTRRFQKRDGGDVTTSIVVENADGARFPSPQRMLDSLLGELTFDPLAFTRMAPKEQFDTLRRFVPGVDFEAIENANRGDYQRRTDVNRRAKEARAAATQIVLSDNAPTEPRDEAALVDELQKAGERNAELEQRKARREQAVEAIRLKRSQAEAIGDEIEDLHRRIRDLTAQQSAAAAEADALQKRLDEAPALPDPIDTTALRQAIASARDHNELVIKRRERDRFLAEATAAEEQSAALTSAMEKREAEKRTAIAAAELPVEGLGFGEGMITMGGVPFDQASDAEQLRVSIAIAAAMNPKLRVIRVRDGSLLDEDGMRLLAEFAAAQDMQVWIERVASGGRVGFVLEDGALKATAADPPAPEPGPDAREGMLV